MRTIAIRRSVMAMTVCALIALACRPAQDAAERGARGQGEIPVLYPVTVDSLELVGAGISETLRSRGWTIRPLSAEGDPSKFPTIVEIALAMKSPAIVTVGTQVTETALGPRYGKDLPPLVAAAIFEPEKLSTLTRAGTAPPRPIEIAIVSDKAPGAGVHLIALLRKLYNKFTAIGILSNRAEANSISSAKEVATAAEQANLGVEMGYLSGPADVAPVTRALLARGVDAICIPHDKIAVAQATTVVELGLRSSRRPVPVVSLDDGTVRKHGVLACVSADYRKIGNMSGELVLRAIEHKRLATIDIARPVSLVVLLNRKTAARLGLAGSASLAGVTWVE